MNEFKVHKDAVVSAFQAQGLKAQIQAQLILSILPFLISYTVFFYFWVFLDWDFLQALTPSSIIFSVGTVLYVMNAQSIREEGVSLGAGPINMTLRWSDELLTGESNVVLKVVTLLEEPNSELSDKAKLDILRQYVRKKSTMTVRPESTDRVFKITEKKTRAQLNGL